MNCRSLSSCAFRILPFVLSIVFCSLLRAEDLSKPIVDARTVFFENDGMVAVEAEHFFKQTLTQKRAFCLTTKQHSPASEIDGDPKHIGSASNVAYLEILPDTRRNHDEKLINGEDFSNQPGKLAVVHDKVNFSNPGRYYVWVRAHSTGSEDNGLHVGIDDQWPESGRRMQWCQGKNTWRWDSLQPTETEHCGVPHQIFLDVENPGVHEIQFSMCEGGFEFDKFLLTTDRNFERPAGLGPKPDSGNARVPEFEFVKSPNKPQAPMPRPVADVEQENKQDADSADLSSSPTVAVSSAPLILPRQPDGDGSLKMTGETQLWHKITFTFNGPYAHEQDNDPNPFLDYEMVVELTHADGTSYRVLGYFAADGNAGETSADSGTMWRAHFSPDRTGKWSFVATMQRGPQVAIDQNAHAVEMHRATGNFEVAPSDKTGRDFRAEGRLKYVNQRYLQHMGSGRYFLKAGADAPETLLGYADFDNTAAAKPNKVPLKSFTPHLQDWNSGDPTWQDGKGKGLIGAINYLSGKGCNAFSFLTYNAGGDGDNVWPFIERNDKLHYDCSKLDQWGVVFDHGTAKGMYLHFKMQETENDDNRGPKNQTGGVPTSLDGGDLGLQRKLYIRELTSRFGHNLGLNWNLGEENTQSTKQQTEMIDYILDSDPYDHLIVVHTFPDRQDKIYNALIGGQSNLTGVSLQNSHIRDTHWQTVKWVEASTAAGRPWVVAFDESGTAAHGQCPDLGYKGFDGSDSTGEMIYDQHAVRRLTLWGTLMGGGAGVEYYFGYKFAENDLVCEDWRSRDQSWDYCRIALEFFHDNHIPFEKINPADELVGNGKHDNGKYCLAEPGEVYLVYLPEGGSTELDLTNAEGSFSIQWFNPRVGGELVDGPTKSITGGKSVVIDSGQTDGEDWLALIRRSGG